MSSWHAFWRTKKMHRKGRDGNSLVVQWLGLHALNCQGPGFDAVVGELSTHKSHSMVKRKKKPTTKKPYKKWGGGLKVNNIKRK